jgi:OOP family OmpA-OmpF porin
VPIRLTSAALVALCMTVVPRLARAETSGIQLTVSPFAGVIFPDDATTPGLDAGPVFGARGGFRLCPWFEVEGTYGASFPERRQGPEDDRLNHLGLDALVHLLPRRRLSPYLAGGWAELEHDLARRETQTLNGWEAGAGLVWRLGERLGVRVDLRDVLVEQDATRSWLHDIAATAGLRLVLGGAVRDSDADGVPDRQDRCAGTPAGASVDAFGCPQDGDGDGVLNGLDVCPETPRGAPVDARGCPSDSDHDGVLDGLDACAGTPVGAAVDARGCPLDGDGDGVADGLDHCPDTPAGTTVDADGCTLPVSPQEQELLDTGAIRLENVQFDVEKTEIKPEFGAVLDAVGAVLLRWPQLELEVAGHTDSIGAADYNQWLSEQRAQAVADYLRARFPGLDTGKWVVRGYGESAPIAADGTRAGRAQNRRVEFRVLDPRSLEKRDER